MVTICRQSITIEIDRQSPAGVTCHHKDILFTAAMSLEADDLVLYLNLIFFFFALERKKTR